MLQNKVGKHATQQEGSDRLIPSALAPSQACPSFQSLERICIQAAAFKYNASIHRVRY